MTLDVANALNNFGYAPKPESPDTDLVQSILTRFSQLEERIAFLEGENAALRSRLTSLESLQESEMSRVWMDIAADRRRLAALEKVTPGPTDDERIEKLEGYLKDKKSAGLKPEASFTEARAYLELSRSQFSQLISKLDPRDFMISPHPLNYKAKMIGLSHKM